VSEEKTEEKSVASTVCFCMRVSGRKKTY